MDNKKKNKHHSRLFCLKSNINRIDTCLIYYLINSRHVHSNCTSVLKLDLSIYVSASIESSIFGHDIIFHTIYRDTRWTNTWEDTVSIVFTNKISISIRNNCKKYSLCSLKILIFDTTLYVWFGKWISKLDRICRISNRYIISTNQRTFVHSSIFKMSISSNISYIFDS